MSEMTLYDPRGNRLYLNAEERAAFLSVAFGGQVSAIMKNFPFFGHGIGLSFEQPRISSAMLLPTDLVDQNLVFGVEAFLSLEGIGSAFVEDILIIGAEGNELLTRNPYHY
jgi:Xaa-Pro dipeptidase